MNPKLNTNILTNISLKFKMVLYVLAISSTLFGELVAKEVSPQSGSVNEVFLTLNMENVELEEVFSKIEEQTEFTFTYFKSNLKTDKKISIKADHESLGSILTIISRDADVRFKRVNDNIFVNKRRKNEPALQEHINDPSEIERIISGQVTDEAGEPIIGVNIVIKGTTQGTISDLEGKYQINVPGDDAVLVFSFVGYNVIETRVGSRSVVDMQMSLNTEALEELVIVGYGTQKKSDLTGAIAQVAAEDFVIGANTSAIQLLNGKASGVHVSQSSSAPGGGLNVKIRGASSINAGNSVLYVIDGLPGGNPDALSPDDIESMQVLKDASSSAIYGSRAANGVVLITTKKGRKGDGLSIDYHGYVGFQSASRQLDQLNGAEYLQIQNDIFEDNLVYEPNPGAVAPYSQSLIDSVGEGTNWQDEVFRNSIITSHQLSLSGGAEKSNFYVGLNYIDNEGVVIESGERKYNARINYQATPTDRFTFGLNFNVNRSELKTVPGGRQSQGVVASALQFDPTISPELNENGIYDVNPAVQIEHPLGTAFGRDQRTVRNTMYSTASLSYEIIDGLKVIQRVGTELDNRRYDQFENGLTEEGRSAGGIGRIENNERTYWVSESLLSYEKEVGDHDFKVLAGITHENFQSRRLRADSKGFLNNITGTNSFESSEQANFLIESHKLINTLRSTLARLEYAYKDKYLLTASFRRDGSSRFANANKNALFPSASVGWKIAAEPFMQNQNFVGDLKLRIGYGEIGNQGINNFETKGTFIPGSNFNAVLGGSQVNGAVPARIPNPELVWETTKEVNVGLDYSVLDFRLSGSIEYYNRLTTDQLFFKPLPLTSGFASVRENFGTVKNNGVDFSLNSKNITKGDLKWETDLVLSFLKNEVTELPDFAQEVTTGDFGFAGQYRVVREGDPMLSFYGYEVEGIFQSQTDIDASADHGPTTRPGDPKFKDQNGDKEITAADRVVLGDPFADFTFGFNNRFFYKNFTLDIYLLGVQGIETYNNLIGDNLFPIDDQRNHIARIYKDRWTPENTGAKYPSHVKPERYGQDGRDINTWTIQDASFVRLKNVTINYRFPMPSGAPLRSASIYFSGENLLTFDDVDGFDPDANAATGGGGVARGIFADYPLARTFRVGVKLGF